MFLFSTSAIKKNTRMRRRIPGCARKIEYWYFVQSADYHYFVSRILFLRHVTEYSQFSGYQCIENYLKAYLKYKEQIPPNSHDLQELLRLCRAEDLVADSFINGDSISIIIAKYEPFYEVARYPVQKQRPKSGYAFLIPDDIFILDYFVMKMREVLSIPANTWDILKNGHYSLFQCQQLYPGFYGIFFSDNINFTEKR
jgi:HEPN domain-containing protein